MESFWEGFIEKIMGRIPHASFKIWIEPLRFGGIDNGELVIKCPNEFSMNWIKENYLKFFKEEAAKLDPQLRLTFLYEHKKEDQPFLPNFSPQEFLKPNFIEKYTFDEFVVGEGNRFAFQACKAIAAGSGEFTDILYLHANTGMGKSHLTQAVGNTIYYTSPQKKFCYTSVNEFTSRVYNAIKEGQLESFKKKYIDECDILLLEELHSIAGKDRTQKELSNAIDMLLRSKKKVLFTSTKLPSEISRLDSEFSSRLVSGLIITINPPDVDTRKKIISRKARNLGLHIHEDVIEYMASRLTGDIRRIEGAVIGLSTRVTLLNQEININIATDVLKNLVQEPTEITINNIKDIICYHFQINCDDLTSRSKKKNISTARQIAMYFSRKYTKESLESIGFEFNRDHATVLHSVKQINKQIIESSKVKLVVEHIKKEIEKKRWKNPDA
jgi:chromosomal replication initiator protein